MNLYSKLIFMTLAFMICIPWTGWAGANTNNPYCEHDPDCWTPVDDPSMGSNCCIPTCFRCVGEVDFCGPTGGTCDWTGSWVCVNSGGCQGNYTPSSTRRCVQSEEKYTCTSLDGNVLTTQCRRYCKVVPFKSCNCASERSQMGVFVYMTDCTEEAK
jgi:hypothetical protein